MAKRCRLCSLPIVEGEDTVDDPVGYWAYHPKLHLVCADGSFDPTKQALGDADSDTPPDVQLRAMPRTRKFTVRPLT